MQCDESRPLCRNCARRFPGIQSCDFDRPAAGPTGSISTALPQSVICRPNHVHESNKLRMLELRLMYHYTKTVHDVLPDHGNLLCRGMWDLDVPQTAFGSDLVMSALLAISALHLRFLTPDDPDLTYAAGHYFGLAVKKYRPALAHITEPLAEPVLMTAMIVGYYTWLVSWIPNPGAPYTMPLQSFYLIRGVFDILMEIGPWIKSTNLKWLFIQPPVEDLDDPASTPFLVAYHLDRERLMKTLDDSISPEDKAVYIAGINYITSICNAITKGAPGVLLREKIAYMIPTLPTRFLTLIAQKDPRAMALIARDLSLLKLVEWSWWLHGPQNVNVEEYHVRGICELMPIEWLWAMDWPLRVASGRLGLHDEAPPVIETRLPNIPLRVIESSSHMEV